MDQDGHVTTNSKLDRDKASVVTLTINVIDINANPQQTGTGKLTGSLLKFLFLFLPCNCLLHHVEDYAMNFWTAHFS